MFESKHNVNIVANRTLRLVVKNTCGNIWADFINVGICEQFLLSEKKHILSVEECKIKVHTFVISRLDCCNVFLYVFLTKKTLPILQKIKTMQFAWYCSLGKWTHDTYYLNWLLEELRDVFMGKRKTVVTFHLLHSLTLSSFVIIYIMTLCCLYLCFNSFSSVY